MQSDLSNFIAHWLLSFLFGAGSVADSAEAASEAQTATETADAPDVALAEALDPARPPDALADCATALHDAGVRSDPARIPLHPSETGQHMCGAPQVIRYRGGPGKIHYSTKPKLTCAMGVALARFETLIQEEATARFGSRVYRIKHLGTYNCREMAAYPGWVSEHSYANAIDIASFTLANGRVISVLDDWDDAGESGEFLRVVARRLYDEDVFSGVITPAFDELHRNHFHIDLAHYRVDGTR